MPFVTWHYRDGSYVRSHFRRAARRAGDSDTPLFTATKPAEVPASARPQRIRRTTMSTTLTQLALEGHRG